MADIDRFEKHWKASQKELKKGLPIPPMPKDDVMLEVDEGTVKEIKKKKRFGIRGRFKLWRSPQSTFLVRMSFSNGTVKQFLIVTKDEVFKYRKRMYYLRYEDAEYNLTHGQYELRYHEDYPVPIDREVHKNEDDNAKTEEMKKAYHSVTSHNLKPLLKMEYVKALAEAQELSKYLKMGLILGVFTLIIVLLLAYYNLKSAGVV